jgi:hypothetical protein
MRSPKPSSTTAPANDRRPRFIRDMQLTIKDISLHVKGSRRRASLPAKPMVMKDGTIAKDDTGKAKFVSILEFASRDVSNAFNAAVINAFGKPGGADPGF